MQSIFRLTGVISYTMMVFLNAFVDLGHKIIIQNTLFKTLDGNAQIIMTGLLNGLILLPLALLFTPSGFLSDRFSKPKVMQAAAFAAMVLTLGITACYYLGEFELAFIMTLFLAMQSALYSPAKYGYLRELVGKPYLTQANALVQAVTIVAILSGTFVFSILFEALLPGVASTNTQLTAREILAEIAPLGWLLVACSGVEFVYALILPPKPAAAPALAFSPQQYLRGRYLVDTVHQVYKSPVIWICIIGLSVFWGISQVMVTVFPAYAKEALKESNTIVIQGLLACFGVGLIAGSALAGKISRSYIETGFIPIGAIGIAILLLILPGLGNAISIGLAFTAVGICSGLFIVPLNALIQFHAKSAQLSRVLAANNLFQTIAMLLFLGVTILASIWSLSSEMLLVWLGLVAGTGAVYTLYRLPHSLIRVMLTQTIGLRYKVAVRGLENMPSDGGVLLLGNHVSFIDWAIIGITCPRKVRFVMHRNYYNKWYLRRFLKLLGCIPIAPGQSTHALHAVNQALNHGEVVCLFPEGALTKNGRLGEFKKGFERAAKNAKGVIVPFHIEGLWGSRFSLFNNASDIETEPKSDLPVAVTFGKKMPIASGSESVRRQVGIIAGKC